MVRKVLFGALVVLFGIIGLCSCTEETTVIAYETGYDDGVYRGGVYIDGELYIPLVLDDENGVATGTVGDFYVQYWDITSTSSYSPNLLSSMTESEWSDFVTKGFYGKYRYDLAFASIDDFWDNYYGGEDASGDVEGMSASWYFYLEGNESPTLGRTYDNVWTKDTEYYYTGEGFDWRIQPTGCPFDGPYFGFGIDTAILAQDVYPYDDNGSKLVFILTIPSKDESKYPTIHFYTYVHVYRDAESFYLPLALGMNADIAVTGEDGDFYINQSDVTGTSALSPNILSGMTYDEWVKLITTGEYGTWNYGFSYVRELDFWNAYWGRLSPINDNNVADGFYVKWYSCEKDSDGEDVYTLRSTFSNEYLRDSESYYSADGFDWRIQPMGCPYDGLYFGFGVNTKVKSPDAYPYDENGNKLVFVLTLPTRDSFAHPDLNFYTILHVK